MGFARIYKETHPDAKPLNADSESAGSRLLGINDHISRAAAIDAARVDRPMGWVSVGGVDVVRSADLRGVSGEHSQGNSSVQGESSSQVAGSSPSQSNHIESMPKMQQQAASSLGGGEEVGGGMQGGQVEVGGRGVGVTSVAAVVAVAAPAHIDTSGGVGSSQGVGAGITGGNGEIVGGGVRNASGAELRGGQGPMSMGSGVGMGKAREMGLVSAMSVGAGGQGGGGATAAGGVKGRARNLSEVWWMVRTCRV